MTANTIDGTSSPAAAAPRRRGRPGHDLAAVIAAGVRVFTERGYHAATMDDVAAALGIAKSSLYHHVSGKEEILQRAIDRGLGALEAVFDAVFDSVERGSASPAAALEAAVRGAVETLITELPSVTLLLRVRGNSPVEHTALSRRRTLDTRLADLVARAQRAGELSPRVDAHLAARLIFGTVNSLVEWYRPTGAADDAVDLADATWAMVAGGLLRA